MKFDWYRLLPQYWIQNEPTCWAWDAALNDLLDNHKIKRDGSYVCQINGVRIWVGNFPYSYGHALEGLLSTGSGLPSVKTRKRLAERIVNDLYRSQP